MLDGQYENYEIKDGGWLFAHLNIRFKLISKMLGRTCRGHYTLCMRHQICYKILNFKFIYSHKNNNSSNKLSKIATNLMENKLESL